MKKYQIYSAHLTPTQKDALINAIPSIFGKKYHLTDNFRLTIENNSDPKILYHYTSMSTLQLILERIKEENNKNVPNSLVLRGTHIEFLNDITEFQLAIKLFTKEIQTYENSLKASENKHIAKKLNPKYWRSFVTLFGNMTSPFITSFSENIDSLPMWNTYGNNGKGVAIGIERIKFSNSTFESKSGNPTWVKCAYDSKLLKNILTKSVKDIYAMFDNKNGHLVFHGFPNTSDLSAYFSLLKHFAFDYEQEWRLIKNYSNVDAEKEIKIIEKDGLLKPYIEHLLPKKILKEIIIGPCSESALIKKSLEMSLQRAGYSVNSKDKNNENFVEIKISKIPFRLI